MRTDDYVTIAGWRHRFTDEEHDNFGKRFERYLNRMQGAGGLRTEATQIMMHAFDLEVDRWALRAAIATGSRPNLKYPEDLTNRDREIYRANETLDNADIGEEQPGDSGGDNR